MSFVYEVWKSCSGIFDIRSKLASEFKEVKKLGPRVAQGMPASAKGVPTSGSKKQVANKTHHCGKVSSEWLQNGSRHLKVYGMFHYTSPPTLGDDFVMGYWMVFGSIFI